MKKIILLLLSMIIFSFFTSCNKVDTHNVVFVMRNNNLTLTINDGQTISDLPSPDNENYSSLGWYLESSYINLFDFDEVITQDTNIYARYSLYELGKENYIAFKTNDLYGFMLPTGEIIVEAKYDRVEPFRYGHALVINDNQFTFIDTLGNEFDNWYPYNPFLYSGYIQFSVDGLSKVYEQNSEVKIINQQNELQFSTYLSVSPNAYFSNGLLPANIIDSNRNQISVYLDEQGEIAISGNNQFTECYPFNEGLALVVIGDVSPKYVFIDIEGNIVIDNNYSTVFPMFDGIKSVYFKEGHAIVQTYTSQEEFHLGTKYMIIDTVGDIVFEIYNEIPVDIYDEYVLTRNESNQFAIYNLNGEKLLDYEYSLGGYPTWGIFEGYIIAEYNGNYGAIEISTGEIAIEFTYEELSPFKNGYAVAKSGGLYGIINQNNIVITDFEYSELFSVYRTTIEYPYIS